MLAQVFLIVNYHYNKQFCFTLKKIVKQTFTHKHTHALILSVKNKLVIDLYFSIMALQYKNKSNKFCIIN